MPDPSSELRAAVEEALREGLRDQHRWADLLPEEREGLVLMVASAAANVAATADTVPVSRTLLASWIAAVQRAESYHASVAHAQAAERADVGRWSPGMTVAASPLLSELAEARLTMQLVPEPIPDASGPA